MSKFYALSYNFADRYPVVMISGDRQFLKDKINSDVNEVYNYLLCLVRTGDPRNCNVNVNFNFFKYDYVLNFDKYVWFNYRDGLRFYGNIIKNHIAPYFNGNVNMLILDLTNITSIVDFCINLFDLGFDADKFPDLKIDIKHSFKPHICEANFGDYLE